MLRCNSDPALSNQDPFILGADWPREGALTIRVVPLLTLRREPSPYLAAVRSALDAEGWTSEVVCVTYELQRGGNQMLRVFRA